MADPEPDTTAPWRYYPLAVGNVWEYEEDSGRIWREAVVGDTFALGRRYFVVLAQGYFEGGPPPQGGNRYPLRYDTTSATVRALGDVSNEYPFISHCPLDAPFGEVVCDLQPELVVGQPDGLLVFGGEEPGTGTDTVRVAMKTFQTRTGFESRYAVDVGPVFEGGEGFYRALTYYKVGEAEHGTPRFPVSSESVSPEPLSAALRAWPNPTAGPTTVSVALANPVGETELAAYDALGRAVRRVPIGPLAAGDRRVPLDLSELSPGPYALVLYADGARAGSLLMTVVR